MMNLSVGRGIFKYVTKVNLDSVYMYITTFNTNMDKILSTEHEMHMHGVGKHT